MANAITDFELDELHAAIEAGIKKQFPSFKVVEFYREETDREPLAKEDLPACILELSEFEPAPELDPGTEQFAVYGRFEARLIIGFRTPRAKLEIRKLAAAFGVFINNLKRWPDPNNPGKAIPAGAVEVLTLVPDDFDPVMDKYEVWRVEWRQQMDLGKSIWTDEGVTPGTPLYSWSPDIGNGHEDDYQEAVPDIQPGNNGGL